MIGMDEYKELSLTFDDSPKNNGHFMTGLERTQRIVDVLSRYNIKTMFFCNSSKLQEDNGEERLRLYGNSGHILANHTHRHLDFSLLDRDSMMREIDEADRILKIIPGFSPWFRFPFSMEGKTIEDKNFLHAELEKRHYQIGYFTIDSADWCMAKLLEEAISSNTTVNFPQLYESCSLAILSTIEYSNRLALSILKRPIRHILVLHETDLTALFLSNLLEELQRRSWNIISPMQAYNDPLSRQVPKGLKTQARLRGLAIESHYLDYSPPLASKEALKQYFDVFKIFS